MTILHNGSKYEIPDLGILPKELSLQLSLASPNAPEQWASVAGTVDTGCEFAMAISRNVIVKLGLEVEVIERVSIGLVDDKTSQADIVNLNLVVRGIEAQDTILLNVPTLVVDLEDQITVGMPLISLFSVIAKQGRINFLAFGDSAIR
jgi:ADP-ribose pyrophosphatase YjhB (NUDIX family)